MLKPSSNPLGMQNFPNWVNTITGLSQIKPCHKNIQVCFQILLPFVSCLYLCNLLSLILNWIPIHHLKGNPYLPKYIITCLKHSTFSNPSNNDKLSMPTRSVWPWCLREDPRSYRGDTLSQYPEQLSKSILKSKQ